MRFELAQGFANGHAAYTEQGSELLLADGSTRGQTAIKNGTTQAFFDHATGLVRQQLLAGQHIAQFDFLGHATSASTMTKVGSNEASNSSWGCQTCIPNGAGAPKKRGYGG
ncbi:hypothetical protein PPS11_33435 [Pseudomonas putida S11]|nr:hypothetical protein PPS11_33435 [Pseudomonas putida S11]